jgi:hypothetical protein
VEKKKGMIFANIANFNIVNNQTEFDGMSCMYEEARSVLGLMEVCFFEVGNKEIIGKVSRGWLYMHINIITVDNVHEVVLIDDDLRDGVDWYMEELWSFHFLGGEIKIFNSSPGTSRKGSLKGERDL